MNFNFLTRIDWKFGEIVEKITIIFLIVLGLSFNFETVKNTLKSNLFPSATGEELLIAYTSIVAGAIVTIIFRLGARMTRLRISIENSKLGIDDKLFAKGAIAIYADIQEKLAELIKEKKPVEMDVLGYTLFSIRNTLEHWKNNSSVKNIKLNLYHLDKDYILTTKAITDDWANLLEIYLGSIRKFMVDEKAYLKKNNIKIILIPYTHLPAVHGFRLHGACIYMSFASWDKNKVLQDPADHSDYIKIDNGDTTKYAQYLRKLFENWVFKASGEAKQ